MLLFGIGWDQRAVAGTRQSEPIVQLDLPAGPVATALAQITERTHASFGTDDPELLRRLAPALRRRGTIERVLRPWLASAGLVAIRVGPRSWRISASARREPRPITGLAQKDNEGGEIIVTASKYGAALATYPTSVSVLDGATLGADASGESGTQAVAALHPTLGSTRLGPGRNKLFLRGIADSSFIGASPALVGQYMGDLRLTYGGPDPDLRLYDIARTEVLEGPQGSLYGAGALGGILRVVPNAPDPTGMSLSGWAGLTATAHGTPGGDVGLIANVPLSSDTALRGLAYSEVLGGYIDDARRGRANVNATTVHGGRLSLRARLPASWMVELSGVVQAIDNADAQYVDRRQPRLSRASAIAEPSHHLFFGGMGTVEGPVGGMRFHAALGAVDQRIRQRFDATQPDGEVLDYRQRDRLRMHSFEGRLTGRFGRHVDWLAGVATLSTRMGQARQLGTPEREGDLGAIRSIVSEATLFHEIAWRGPKGITFTVGGRGSRIVMQGRATGAVAKPLPGTLPPRPERKQWLATPTVALSWAPSSKMLIYGRYAGGYRPGGLTVAGAIERFDPDTVRTVEVGLRSGPLGRAKLRIEASLAHTRWRSVQSDTVDGLGLFHTANIGDGVVRNASMTIAAAPIEGLTIAASGFVSGSRLRAIQSSIDNVSLSRLPNVADYGAMARIDYSRESWRGHRLTLGTRVERMGPSLLGIGPQLAFRQGDYTVVSAAASLSLSSVTLVLDAWNLLDTRGNLFALGTPFTVSRGTQATPMRPRAIRIGFKVQAL